MRQAQPPAVIFCTAFDQYALERAAPGGGLPDQARARGGAGARPRQGRPGEPCATGLAGRGGDTTGGRRARVGAPRTHLVSQTHRGVETMPVTDVRCLLAEQKYVTACSPTAQLLIPDTLKELEQEYGERFVRVHRNALVARAHIVRLQRDEDGTWYVVLDGVEQRPAISRRHLAEVKQRLVAG